MKANSQIILFVLPVLAEYRVDFLNELNANLYKANITLIVITGNSMNNKIIKEYSTANFIIHKCDNVGYSFLGFDLRRQKGLFKYIRKLKPSKLVMLYNAGNINYNLLLLSLWIRKVPYYLWGCGYENKNLAGFRYKLKSFVKNFLIKRAKAYISYSSFHASQILETGQKKVIIAQNTINVERIVTKYSSIEKPEIKNGLKFFYVGALTPEKRLDKAIECFSILKEKKISFTFTIVGDGIIKKELEKRVVSMKLKDCVFLTGAKYGAELEEIFLSSHVFLLTGLGGLALNEAMAYGKPVISTPADFTAYDLIVNNENGFLIPYNFSNEELINILIQFTKKSNDEIYKMGMKSREIIIKKATLQNMVDSFAECILN